MEHDTNLDTRWRKSSFSTGSEPQCVEVAQHPTAVGVRDSKNPRGPRLRLSTDAWGRLVSALKL
jgi:hypothetical protein